MVAGLSEELCCRVRVQSARRDYQRNQTGVAAGATENAKVGPEGPDHELQRPGCSPRDCSPGAVTQVRGRLTQLFSFAFSIKINLLSPLYHTSFTHFGAAGIPVFWRRSF